MQTQGVDQIRAIVKCNCLSNQLERLTINIAFNKCTNCGGQTKRANERIFVYRPPAWRRCRNVKATYSGAPNGKF